MSTFLLQTAAFGLVALLLLAGTSPASAQTPPFDAKYASGFESGEISLKPAFSAALQGNLNANTLPQPLMLRLSAPVANDTVISIVSSEPGRLEVPGGGVTILAGQSSALVPVNAYTAGAAPVLLTATVDDESVSAAVRVEKVLNETDVPAEMDYCATLFPPFFSVKTGTLTPDLFARVFETGVTAFAGPPGGWMVGAGYGPAGTDPRLLADWQWKLANYNLQAGNDDEYMAALPAPQASGVYTYAFRMSLDGGGSWTYCDYDGAGSNGGLAFSLAQLPKMYVYGDDVRNGTGLPAEADYCVLQFPPTITVMTGALTDPVYGRLFETGVTEAAGAPPGWIAQAGFGPKDSDPRVPSDWTFFNAPFNTQIANNDEFGVAMQAPNSAGEYAYVFRVSQDSGNTWTYCDKDGAGSSSELPFLPSQLGLMTVQPPPP